MKRLLKYKNIYFDLDDTLINEKTYLYTAYEQINNYLSKYGHNVLNFMITTFKNEGRSKLFNKMLNNYKIPLSEINNILNILRTCNISINLTDKAKSIINKITNNGIKWHIITNGNHQQQKNKIKSITPTIYPYSIQFSNKPNIDGITIIPNSVYIGDSEIDYEFSKSINTEFINISSIIN